MDNETAKPHPELSAEEILARYRPADEPVVITLPEGETLTFRPITSTQERNKLFQSTARFVESLPAPGTPEHKHHPLKDVIPWGDVEAISLAFILHERSIKPKISKETAFLFHRAPELIEYLEKMLGLADRNLFELTRQRFLDDARKKSQTPGTGESSPPASESSPVETPTA
jgi:hypothetical protein